VSDQTAVWMLTAGYFGVLLVIGFWAGRKIKSFEGYFLADRRLGFWVFTILMVGSMSSGMALLGAAGLGYFAGWPTIWEQTAVPLGVVIALCVFGPRLHAACSRAGHLTVQDYLAERYESPMLVRGLSAMTVVIISLIYMVGQYTAIGITMQRALGISYEMGVVIGAVLVTVYVFVGGLYAVSWTTLFQGLILVLGVVGVAPIIVSEAGGMTEVNRVLGEVDPHMLAVFYPQQHPPVAPYAFMTPAFAFSLFVLLSMGLSCAPHVINNILAIPDSRYFRWAPLAAFVIFAGFFNLIKWAGLATRSLAEKGALSLPEGVANPNDFAFLVAVETVARPEVQALFGVIVLAAVMSTTDRLLLTVGGAFAWDIYRNIFRPEASDRAVMNVSRGAVVASAALSLVLALYPMDLLAWLIWMGVGIMLAVFTPSLFAGLYWKRANRLGAVLSMSVGLAASCGFGYYDRFVERLPVHFSLPAFCLSVAALVVCAWLPHLSSDSSPKLQFSGRRRE